MPGSNNVHLTDYNPAKMRDLHTAVSEDFVSMSDTGVVICRLPQRGAFLEAQYQIPNQTCCTRCQLAFSTTSSSSTLPGGTLRAAGKSR